MDYPVEENELYKVSRNDEEVMERDNKLLHLSFVDFDTVKDYLLREASAKFKLDNSFVPVEVLTDITDDRTR